MFDWQIADERAPAPVPTRAPRRRISPRRLRAASAAVAALLVLGGVWLLARYQDGERRIRQDLADAVAEETLAWNAGDANRYRALLDPAGGGAWRAAMMRSFGEGHNGIYYQSQSGPVMASPVLPSDQWWLQTVQLVAVEWQSDLAVVRVSVRTQDPFLSEYDETRIYRRVGNRWARSSSGDALWGPGETLDTAHFRLVFQRRDRPAARAAARDIEGWYQRVRRDYGLRERGDDGPITVEIVATPVEGLEEAFEGPVRVPSPWLVAMAPRQSAEAQLRWEIGLAVTKRLQGQAGPIDRYASSGLRFVLSGLNLWEARQWAGEMVPWERQRAALVRQAVQDLARRPAQSSPALPMLSVAQRSDDLQDGRTAYLLATTMADFIADRFGSERFGAVIAAARPLGATESRISAALRLTSWDLEREWAAYLIRTYGEGHRP